MRRLNFRRILFLAFMGVALSSLLIVGGVSLRLHQKTVDELTSAIAEESLGRMVDRLDERVQIVVEHNALFQRLCPTGELTSRELGDVAHRLWAAFEAHSDLTYMGVGIIATGEYAVVGRAADGSSRVRMYVRNPAARDEILNFAPGPKGLLPVSRQPWKNAGLPRETYDLNARPFVQLVREVGHSVWTESYDFWGRGGNAAVQGVTFVTPMYDADGRLSVVWNIDLDLRSLTKFFNRVSNEVRGRMFLIEQRKNGSWKLLAAALPEEGRRTNAMEEFVEKLNSGALKLDRSLNAESSVRLDGADYRIIGSRLHGSKRPEWQVVELIPADEHLITFVLGARWLLIAFVVTGLGASLAAFHLSQYVALPLQILERESRLLVKGERTEMPVVGGPAEVRQLAGALNDLAIEVRDRQREVEATHHELRVSHERLQVHVSDTPVGMLEISPAGRIVSWNRAAERILGWTSSEALNQRYDLIVPPNIRPNIEEIVVDVMRQRGGFRNENQNITKDGRIIDCEWYNTPLIGEDGQTFGIASLFLDITERKRIQAELLELNERLDTRVRERTAELQRALADLQSFSYSVAHDLRAPLRSIDGFSQLLAEDCEGSLTQDGGEHLQRIRAATQRMADLIDALLRLTRVVRQEVRLEWVNLSELFEQAMQHLLEQESDRDMTWSAQPDCRVWGDKQLLRVLIENLTDNAWKYTRQTKGAHVRFFSEQKDDGCWFAVRDNGIGFDAKYARKALQPFQRLHRMEEFEGHGIGLATAVRIAQKHGGSLRLEASPDRGATCWFQLAMDDGPRKI